MNHVNGTVVSVVASSVEEFGSETKDYELVFAFFPLNTQHQEVRANTGGLGIRIMCPSGTTCLPADCCFGELAL
jgi:hypothetical protein